MFAITLNLTMKGNEMQNHRQTSPEPESALQHIPSHRIATNQCSKKKKKKKNAYWNQLLIKGFCFFFKC